MKKVNKKQTQDFYIFFFYFNLIIFIIKKKIENLKYIFNINKVSNKLLFLYF